MHQSRISEKNLARLEKMTKSQNPEVAGLAAIVLKVGRVKPYKRRRLRSLARMHPELIRDLEDTGLILAHTWDWEPMEETEIFTQENFEATYLSAEEDWEIPF